MKRLYQKEIAPRLKELKPAMNVGVIEKFSYGRKSYEIPYVIAESENSPRKRVFLSAGIHGNEVAGVYALLDFLRYESAAYSRACGLVAIPCLNPSGFEQNTRANHDNVDLNRDFVRRPGSKEARIVKKFLKKVGSNYRFCLNAHEDPSDVVCEGFSLEDNPIGFYLYMHSPWRRAGRTVLRSVEDRGNEVCKSRYIYEDLADDGLVWWRAKRYRDGKAGDSTLETHLLNYTSHSLAPETPTCWPLEKRIEAHKTAIRSAIELLVTKGF